MNFLGIGEYFEKLNFIICYIKKHFVPYNDNFNYKNPGPFPIFNTRLVKKGSVICQDR